MSPRHQLYLFDGGPPDDGPPDDEAAEAALTEPAVSEVPKAKPLARRVDGPSVISSRVDERAPRHLLVRIEADAKEAEALLERVQAALRALHEDAEIRSVDPAHDLPWTELSFLALDTETTGLDPREDDVIELAWVRFARGEARERFSQLCSIDRPLPPSVHRLTGIHDDMLREQPPAAASAAALVAAMRSVDFVVAYNAPFDRAFLTSAVERAGLALPQVPWIDPLVFIREIDRYKPGKRLSDASRRWGVDLDRPHRAIADAEATGELLLRIAPFLPARTLFELLEHQQRWSQQQQAELRSTPAQGPPAQGPPAQGPPARK